MQRTKRKIRFIPASLVLLLTSMPVLSAQYDQDSQTGRSDRSQSYGSSQTRQESQDRRAGLSAEQAIQDWKETPKKAAREMIKKYGQPQEVTGQRLVWRDNGPWKRTEVINEDIDHNFPMPHKDALLQVIDYQVPADKFDELAAFDGSVIAERTRGELAARCDKEQANILALNLSHEIVTGKRSVEEARKMYGEQIVAAAQDRPASYTRELNVNAQMTAGDPDKTTLDKSTVERVTKLMKEQEEKMARGPASEETMTH